MAVIKFSGDDPLGQARSREQILSAQMLALDNVAELVDIARKADSPIRASQTLQKAWRITDLQAQAIIEMQVQSFTRLQHLSMRDELRALREYIAERDSSGN